VLGTLGTNLQQRRLSRARTLEDDISPFNYTSALYPLSEGKLSKMLSRSAIGRQAQRAVRNQWQQPASRRGLAAPASGSFQYETGNAAGVKYAARDMPGPTTHLALVSQAGTRFETAPGLTVGLQSFAFKVRQHPAIRIGSITRG